MRPYGLHASFFPLVGLPLAVPLPAKLKKKKECTYQSHDPEGCTYQSSDPERYTYQSSDPEGCTYQSSAPEGCTYQSSAPKGCTYQSSAPEGCTYPPLSVLSASGTWDEEKEAPEVAIGVRDRSGVERRSDKKLGYRGGSTTTIGRRRRLQVKLRRETRLDGRRRGDADEGGGVRDGRGWWEAAAVLVG
ncbi:NBS-LRR type resistance protein [Cucumis melo var. makuwa]|uniref:NBS-LRR type resistance protein n=1 Tax=Cucumis melo var. makuwa TaxID=1194695 RepID=A0A5A7TLP7_CUCMM|nr:NBS-LRR type resistance protein [Cucumis melo var. makuwa]